MFKTELEKMIKKATGCRKENCDGCFYWTNKILSLHEQSLASQKKELVSKLEKMDTPDTGLTDDDLMHYEEGYFDAQEDAISLLSEEQKV